MSVAGARELIGAALLLAQAVMGDLRRIAKIGARLKHDPRAVQLSAEMNSRRSVVAKYVALLRRIRGTLPAPVNSDPERAVLVDLSEASRGGLSEDVTGRFCRDSANIVQFFGNTQSMQRISFAFDGERIEMIVDGPTVSQSADLTPVLAALLSSTSFPGSISHAAN